MDLFVQLCVFIIMFVQRNTRLAHYSEHGPLKHWSFLQNAGSGEHQPNLEQHDLESLQTP